MQFRTQKKRRVEQYTNFAISNEAIFEIAEKHLFSIPIVPVGEQPPRNALYSIRYAFISADDVQKLIDQCPMLHSKFNDILMTYTTRQVDTIDPRFTPHGNFSISRPTSRCTDNNLLNMHMSMTDEMGEFCNLSLKNHIVLSYWKKDEMKSFQQIDISTLVTLLNYSFPNFHFGRSSNKGFGLNVYNGMIQCLILF